MNQYDFIAIGDITTDTFILLKEAETHCEVDSARCTICMRFGDKIPFEEVEIIHAVGNSANAAVSAHRLGLSSALVTVVGDDANADETIATLTAEGISTEYVRHEQGKRTNHHYVLRYGAERTILIKHEVYAYTLPVFTTAPKWLYLSSAGESSIAFHHEVAQYLAAHPETKLAFQPGTFQMKLKDKLQDIYQAAELFFCNKEEAQRILDTEESDIKVLLEKLRAYGPNIVVITEGPAGANAFDGNEMLYMPIYPDPAPPRERTGAGDAFASTFTAMIAQGHTVREALERAPINSMNVVQHIGAQKGLLTKAEIETYLKNAPSEYKIQAL